MSTPTRYHWWLLGLAFAVAGFVAALIVQGATTTEPNAAAPAPQVRSQQAQQAQAQESQFLSPVYRGIPQFELPSLEGQLWTHDNLKGRAWVVNFWATWCPPCIEEIPSMNAAYQVLEPAGIGMLAINAGENVSTVQAFLEEVPIDFFNLVGQAHTLKNWSVRALPTTFIVDDNGAILYEALGPREWDDPDLLQQIKTIVGEAD